MSGKIKLKPEWKEIETHLRDIWNYKIDELNYDMIKNKPTDKSIYKNYNEFNWGQILISEIEKNLNKSSLIDNQK